MVNINNEGDDFGSIECSVNLLTFSNIQPSTLKLYANNLRAESFFMF